MKRSESPAFFVRKMDFTAILLDLRKRKEKQMGAQVLKRQTVFPPKFVKGGMTPCHFTG